MSWDSLIFWGVGLGMGWLAAALRPKPGVADGNMAQQLQQAQLRSQLADQMAQFKSGFLARTSHELRSPLNSVISLHQLILSDLCDSPEEERLFVGQAHDAATKMLKLLDEMIYISKLEYGSSQLQLQPIGLADLLDEVWRLTHLQAQNRNLRLEIAKPDPDIHVLADLRCLRQVLVSLITSPIALMQEGTICLTTLVRAEDQQVKILVVDQRPTDQLPLSDSTDPSVLPFHASAELSLMLNQTLMQLMQGRLEIISMPAAESATAIAAADSLPMSELMSIAAAPATAIAEPTAITQVACWLPLSTAEPDSFKASAETGQT